MDTIIPLKDFEQLCMIGQRYEGYVQGLGKVFWKPHNVSIPMVSHLPSLSSSNLNYAQYRKTTVYELMVVKTEQNPDIEALRRFRDVGINVVSLANIAASSLSDSTKPLVFGPEYNIVNSGGTRVRNLNRTYTNVGKVAQNVGHTLTGIGIIVDWSMVALGEQTLEEAAVNTVVNAGIWAIGLSCTPAAVVLGIAWFIMSLSERSYVSSKSYVETFGSITPPDKTRVAPPFQPPPPKERKMPVYYKPIPSFEPYKRR
jgi:hypothetical protein